MIAEIDRVSAHAEQMAASVTAAARDISGPQGIPAIPKAADKLPAAAGSIDAFNDELKRLREQFTATGSAIERAKLGEQVQAAERRISIAMGNFPAAAGSINALGDELARLRTQFAATGSAIERAHLGPQIADLERQIESANTAIPKATKSMGASIVEFASQYAAAFGAAAVAAVVAFVKESVAAFMDYETAVADLSAITGAAGAELEGLEAQAKQMGIGIQGGAVAAVEGFKIVKSAMADLKSDEVAKVTKEALALAQASGMEVPEATKSLSAALNQMELGAADAARTVNVLGAAAKFGASEIPSMTEALLKFGGVAASAKFSVEESAAAIQTLAKFGIEGGEAGTALRNIGLAMTNIKGLPKEALDGLARTGVNLDIVSNASLPAAERLREFAKVMQDGVAAEAAFGKENIVAAGRLLENIPLFEQLTAQVTGTNVAYEQAAINNNTLAHSFLEIKNRIGVVMIELGAALAPVLRLLSEAFVPAWEIVKTTFVEVYGPIYEVGKSIFELAKTLGFAAGEGNIFVSIVEGWAEAMKIATLPMRAIVEVINLIIKAVTWAVQAFKDARQAVIDFGDRVPIVGALIDGLLGPINAIIDAYKTINGLFNPDKGLTDTQNAYKGMRETLAATAKQMGATDAQIKEFVKTQSLASYATLSLSDAAQKAKFELAKFLDMTTEIDNNAPKQFKRVSDSMDGVGAAAKLAKNHVEELTSRLIDPRIVQLSLEVGTGAVKDSMDLPMRNLEDFTKTLQTESDAAMAVLDAQEEHLNTFAEGVTQTFAGLKDGMISMMTDMGYSIAEGIGYALAAGGGIGDVLKKALQEAAVQIPKMAGMALLNAATNPINSAIALPLAVTGAALLGLSGILSGVFKGNAAKQAAMAAPTAGTTAAMPTPNRSGLEAYNGSNSDKPMVIYFDGPSGEKFHGWVRKGQQREQGRRGG